MYFNGCTYYPNNLIRSEKTLKDIIDRFGNTSQSNLSGENTKFKTAVDHFSRIPVLTKSSTSIKSKTNKVTGHQSLQIH